MTAKTTCINAVEFEDPAISIADGAALNPIDSTNGSEIVATARDLTNAVSATPAFAAELDAVEVRFIADGVGQGVLISQNAFPDLRASITDQSITLDAETYDIHTSPTAAGDVIATIAVDSDVTDAPPPAG